jgi:hypothetical protein
VGLSGPCQDIRNVTGNIYPLQRSVCSQFLGSASNHSCILRHIELWRNKQTNELFLGQGLPAWWIFFMFNISPGVAVCLCTIYQ